MAIHYTKTNWLNNEQPAINQSNLNKIEQGIYDATEALNDRVQTVNNQSPDADGNVELQTLPSGGTAGQTIIKQSSTEGDAIWADLNATGIELTQAEYDALSEAEKNNGSLYFITDGESAPSANRIPASGVTYGTGSVADALDGLNVIVVTTSGTTLTSYTTQGMYWFSSGVTPSDIPEGVNGWLVVIPSTTGWVKQIWMRAGTPDYSDFHTWIRTYNGSTWGSWYRLITSADMSNMMTSVESSAIPDFTINSSGYYNVQSYVPSAPSGYSAQFYLIGTWSSVSTNDAISLTWNGSYVLGSAGAVVKGLKIRAICTKNI